MIGIPVLETGGKDVVPASDGEKTKSKKRPRTGSPIPPSQLDAREQLWDIATPEYSPYRILSKIKPYYQALRFTTAEDAKAADNVFKDTYPRYPKMLGRSRKQLHEGFMHASSADAQLLLIAITHLVARHCRDLLLSVPEKGEALAPYGESLAVKHAVASWWYAIWRDMMEARGKELEADVFSYL